MNKKKAAKYQPEPGHLSVDQFKRDHPEFVSEVVVPIALTLLMMFSVWKFFGLKNVLLTVPFSSMYVRYSRYRPSEWPVIRMLILSAMLVFLSWIAGFNPAAGLFLNLIIVFYLVFYFTNSKTDRIYFEYVYIYITTQSHRAPLQTLILREQTAMWCCLLIVLFLVINNMVMRRSLIPDFDFRTLQVLRLYRRGRKSLHEKNVRAYRSFLHIFAHPFHKKHHFFRDERNFHYHKTRFAMRCALLVSFCFLLSWMMNTPMETILPLLVFLMIMPYYDTSLIAIKVKVKGNICAVLLSFVLTSVFETEFDLLCLIGILVVLTHFYPTNFQNTLCSVTTALVVNSVMHDTLALLSLRLFYVLLAVIIAVAGNRFLYRNPARSNLTY